MNNTIRKINVFLVLLLVVLIIVVGGFLLLPASAPPPPILMTGLPSVTKLPTQFAFQEPANTLISPQDETNITATPSGVQLTSTPLPAQLTPTTTDTAKIPTIQANPASTESLPSSVIIQQAYLPDGMYLTISGPTLPTTYRLGPLARGAYALGPNGLFMAYVTNDGQVFALRLSNGYFARVADLRRILSSSLKNVDPYYRLSFYDAGFVMFLIIYEDGFDETNPVWLPRSITY
jgi:hypothetical protein